MALKQNIIYIYFKGKHLVTSKSQYQYNHGQFLYFADLDLPQTFEVHFSNRDRGDSKPQVGSNKLVEIPDEYYWSGALMIYAWIYLHTGKDDGETIYEVKIPLIKRAKPTNEEPLPVQQSAIDRAIAELNNAVDITNENADKTNADKTQVATIKEEVITLKEEIDSTASAVSQNAQSARESADASEQSAQNSAEFENNAHNYADEAKGYAQSALESKNTASQKAQVATDASAEAKDFRDEAETFKNEAEQAKQNIVDYRNETKGYRDEALTAKNDAQDSANAAQRTSEQMTQAGAEIIENVRDLGSRYATQAETAANNAEISAESASSSAQASAQSASQAEQIKADVEELADDAQEYATASANSASASAQSATMASESANSASASANMASGKASEASGYAQTASQKATEASGYANTSSQKASESANSASLALGYKNDALQAKTDAETAQASAEQARDDAQTAQELAETAESNAESTVHGVLDSLDLETISGSIVETHDAFPVSPEKMVVDINPVQNLNGYDSPWVGGSGKNLFKNTMETHTVNGVTFTVNNDGSVTVSGDATANIGAELFGLVTLPAGEYKANGYSGGASGSTRLIFAINTPISPLATIYQNRDVAFTLTEETVVRVYPIIGSSYTGTSTFYPMIRKSTESDASYVPYENICPISGWTEANIPHTGENLRGGIDLANDIKARIASAVINTEEKTVSWSYNATHNAVYAPKVPFKENTRYTFIVTVQNASKRLNFRIYYTDGSVQALPDLTTTEKETLAIVTSANKTVRTIVRQAQGGTTKLYYDESGIFEGVLTAEDFEPYKGRTINVNWETEAGTVYGGKLDVLSGVMRVTKALVDAGTLAITVVSSSNGVFSFTLPNGLVAGGNGKVYDAICDTYKFTTNGYNESHSDEDGVMWMYAKSANVRVRDSRLIGYSAAEAKAALSGVDIDYPLATPLEIQLTPQQITLFKNYNALWADTGDISEFAYRVGEFATKADIPEVPVEDVQVNGTSIVSNGVANVPVANANVLGAVMVAQDTHGLRLNAYGRMMISSAESSSVKGGINTYTPITPSNQHESAFYGLAKASGTDEKESELPVGQYTDEAKASIKSMLGVDVGMDDILKAFPTDTASGAIASFPDGADDIPLKSLVVDIDPVQGLHGYDHPWVGGAGKNLFDETSVVISDLSPVYGINSGTALDGTRSGFDITLPNGTYTVSISELVTSYTYANVLNADNSLSQAFILTTTSVQAGKSFSISDGQFLRVFHGTNGALSIVGAKMQIEVGSTATDWTPYENICPISGWTGMQLSVNGTVIPISWQSEAGTVYGGTLDVLSGVMTIDKIGVDLSAQTWSTKATGTTHKSVYTQLPKPYVGHPRTSENVFNPILERYTKSGIGYYSGAGDTKITNPDAQAVGYLYYSNSNTPNPSTIYLIAEIDDIPSGLIVYNVAEPITVQLDAHTINSLYGVNNIWADTGDTSAEYRADTKLYINKKITEAISALT